MAGFRITSPDQVISHISVLPNPAAPDIDNLLHLYMARYLRGVGHPLPMPTSPTLASTLTSAGVPALTTMQPDIITQAMRDSPQGKSTTYRAERFLALATGSELLPLNPNYVVTVSSFIFDISELILMFLCSFALFKAYHLVMRTPLLQIRKIMPQAL